MSTNGCIIPGTPIAVDFWRVAGLNAGNFVFFLTHLHGDHIVGLTSTWRYPIYCSELTAELLATQHGVERSLLHPLEVGSSHLVPVPSKDGQSSYIAVSVINANHCPGSVMFLFEGPFGKILHTGDFRYKPDLIEKSILNDHTCSIDVIYLDNTFCSPECSFPTQHEARQTILDIIRQHWDCDVVLGMRKLGKENLLAWLALSLKEWISVPGEMYSRIQTLELPNVFRINDKMARIRVEPFHLVTKKKLKRWNETKKTIVILPTAIYTGIGGIPYSNQKDFFVVPYSDHSSYSELLEFVSKLKPCAVVPIVSSKTRGPFGVDLSSRADMSCFDRYCRKPADGVNSRQALRVIGKPSGMLLPVLGADGKHKTLKRKRSVGNRKVIKGVEYLSEGDNLDGEISRENSSDETVKAKIFYADSVANTETNLHNNSCDERNKHKVICKCSVANNTDLHNRYSKIIKQEYFINSTTNVDVHLQTSYCPKPVDEKVSCVNSTASSDNHPENYSDNTVTDEVCFNHSVTNSHANSNHHNCYQETVAQKISCNYSVTGSNPSSNHSVAISDEQNHQDSSPGRKVKEKINCSFSKSGEENIMSMSPDKRLELSCNSSVTNIPKVRKLSHCLNTNLNSLTTKDEICLKTDPCKEKEKRDLPSTNCRFSYNEKQISSSPLSLPECADVKHMVDLSGNGFKRTNTCCSHGSCLGPLTFKDPNNELFSRCRMVVDMYSVKSLKQTDCDRSAKKLVLALEKWLLDT